MKEKLKPLLIVTAFFLAVTAIFAMAAHSFASGSGKTYDDALAERVDRTAFQKKSDVPKSQAELKALLDEYSTVFTAPYYDYTDHAKKEGVEIQYFAPERNEGERSGLTYEEILALIGYTISDYLHYNSISIKAPLANYQEDQLHTWSTAHGPFPDTKEGLDLYNQMCIELYEIICMRLWQWDNGFSSAPYDVETDPYNTGFPMIQLLDEGKETDLSSYLEKRDAAWNAYKTHDALFGIGDRDDMPPLQLEHPLLVATWLPDSKQLFVIDPDGRVGTKLFPSSEVEALRPDYEEEQPTNAETLKKPVIDERFDTDGTPEEIRFFIDTGDEEDWRNTLHTRSVAILSDGDAGPDPDNIVNAAIIRRNCAVEEELGVKIVVKEHGGIYETAQILKPILMAGDDVYDVMVLNSFYDTGLAVKDTVYSFLNFENMPEGASYIDPADLSPWWNKAVFDATRLPYIKNPELPVNFFITGDIAQTLIGNMPVSYVNKTMWDRFADEIGKLRHSGGYNDIYKIVENGYWTLDLLIELSELCYVPGSDNPYGKSDGTYDQVGVLTYSNERMNAVDNTTVEYFSYGAHVEYTSMDSRGIPSVHFDSENNLKFYEKLAALMCSANCGLLRTENPSITKQFSTGNALMTVDRLCRAEESYMKEMRDEWILLPLPMLDHDQYDPDDPSLGYRTSLSEISLLSICSTAGLSRIPAITATLELMGYYSKQLVTPASLDLFTGGKYAHDKTSTRMLDLALDGVYADFGMLWAGNLIVNCGGSQAYATCLTWYLRQYYDDVGRDPAQGNAVLGASLTKLLNQLFEPFPIGI